MPPHAFQVTLARPTHSRAVRRLMIPPGESGDVQRETHALAPTLSRMYVKRAVHALHTTKGNTCSPAPV
eukprot:444635-Prymnesium_polylepis.1